jgi:hypothetical protein
MAFNVTMVTFWRTFPTNNLIDIVIKDGRVHPLTKALPPLVSNQWWENVMDDWNLDTKPLGRWQLLQHHKYVIPKNLQGITNNVGLTFNVGDTLPRFMISIEQDN